MQTTHTSAQPHSIVRVRLSPRHGRLSEQGTWKDNTRALPRQECGRSRQLPVRGSKRAMASRRHAGVEQRSNKERRNRKGAEQGTRLSLESSTLVPRATHNVWRATRPLLSTTSVVVATKILTHRLQFFFTCTWLEARPIDKHFWWHAMRNERTAVREYLRTPATLRLGLWAAAIRASFLPCAPLDAIQGLHINIILLAFCRAPNFDFRFYFLQQVVRVQTSEQ
jgi:hypothetical protein